MKLLILSVLAAALGVLLWLSCRSVKAKGRVLPAPPALPLAVAHRPSHRLATSLALRRLSESGGPEAGAEFMDSSEGPRIFSMDWRNLKAGRTYQVESSYDGQNWEGRSSVQWTDTDPLSVWRSQFPALPPTPFTVMEWFRLKDVTP